MPQLMLPTRHMRQQDEKTSLKDLLKDADKDNAWETLQRAKKVLES